MSTTTDAAATPPPAPTLRGLRWAVTSVPVVQAALLLALLPAVADAGRPALPLAAALALGGALGLAALLWWALGRVDGVLAGTRRSMQRMQELFDALPLGIAVYDPKDRLELFNNSFRQLYTPLGDALRVGRTFTELLRAAVDRGLVPDAKGREEAWIEERVWSHSRAAYGTLREMPDGRFRRIVEHRLSDGGLLAYSVDVTDLVRREQSVEAARREADLARALLHDAIEALPAAFELFDADDRLLLCNSHLRAMYPRIAHLMNGRPLWEDVVRAHRAAGGLQWVGEDFEGWLAERQRARRRPGTGPRVHPAEGGRFVRLHEQRTSSGGLVCVRVDVTDWVERGDELAQLRATLDTANARLAALAEAPVRPAADGARRRGLHLTADLHGCGADAPMADVERLRTLCRQAVEAAGLQAVGERFHGFPDAGGVTGVVLLAESHLAVHTWPEHAAVTLDVFACNLREDNRARARALLSALEAAFAPSHAVRHAIERTLVDDGGA